MSIPRSVSSVRIANRADFEKQLQWSMKNLADNGVATKVKIRQHRAEVTLAGPKGNVTVQLETPPSMESESPSKAAQWCTGFWIGFSSKITPADMIKGGIYLTLPVVGYVDMAAQVIGFLVALIGKLTGNESLQRKGADLLEHGILKPIIQKTLDTIMHTKD